MYTGMCVGVYVYSGASVGVCMCIWWVCVYRHVCVGCVCIQVCVCRVCVYFNFK